MIDLSKPVPKSRAKELEPILKSWATLTDALAQTNTSHLDQVRQLLQLEMAGASRMLFVQRLLARYSKLESRMNELAVSAAYGAKK